MLPSCTVHSELADSHGRADTVVESERDIFVLEYKVDRSAAEALHQIHEKEYFARYQNESRPVYLLGINFDTERRAVREISVERLRC